MTSDPLAGRVRDAVGVFAIPAMPAATIAARLASAHATRAAAPRRRRPVGAVLGGVAVLAAALAVAVPTASTWMTPAYYKTLQRLTGHDFSHERVYEVAPMTLEQARRLTRFPIVLPRGKRVLNADPYPHDAGVTLIVAVDAHGSQATLDEHWAGAKPWKYAKQLDGVGIRNDGTIRRFSARRWRIGRVEFSVPVFNAQYQRYAAEVERATRATAVATP